MTDNIVCKVCESWWTPDREGHDTLSKCNECDCHFHSKCVGLDIIPNDWICPRCSKKSNKLEEELNRERELRITYEQELNRERELRITYEQELQHANYQVQLLKEHQERTLENLLRAETTIKNFLNELRQSGLDHDKRKTDCCIM